MRMSDSSGYRYGYQRPPIKIFEGELKLDPAITAKIEAIERDIAARKLIEEMTKPDWSLVLASLQLPQLPLQPLPAPGLFPTPPSQPATPPASGPDTPRAGEASDVLKALYKLPAVQRIVGQAHDEASRQIRVLRVEWQTAPTSQRVIMISMGTIVAAGFIGPIIGNKPTRDLAFGFIKGKDIPVPGVDGLSFKILDHGGGITAPLILPGLSGSGELEFPNSSGATYKATITFDVMEFLRSRAKK
jgi:hypothetical protein